jgi:hypothetical protein
MGRPPRPLTDADVATAVRLAADGATHHAICEALPCSPMMLAKWVASYPDFAAEYARAREVGALRRLDELHAIIRTKPADQVEATWQRTVASIAQWELSKALPRIYGDRLNHEHSGVISVSVTTGIDLASLPTAQLTQSPQVGVIGYSLDDDSTVIDLSAVTTSPAAPVSHASLPADAMLD